jgi:protein-arginine kinase activator protein McsA
MATPTDTICDVCHERRAIHFVCYGGTDKSSHLCDECFESSTPPEVRESVAEVRDAHCQYCGGQPCAGGTDIFALITGVQKSKHMCMPCSMEYHRFIQQKSSDAAGLSQQEQLAVIRKLIDEADAHMKRWLSERDS